MALEDIRKRVSDWSALLRPEVSIDSLRARCEVAHRWNATFRTVLLREVSMWRMQRLGSSFVHLMDSGEVMSARIILRSAIETAAVLAYSNKKMSDLIEGKLHFSEFNEVTKCLLLGGRADGDLFEAKSVITIVNHFAKNHDVVKQGYERLSEDVHPNACGMILSHGDYDSENQSFGFHRKIDESDAAINHTLSLADLTFILYEMNYVETWSDCFVGLERWLEENDKTLSLLQISS